MSTSPCNECFNFAKKGWVLCAKCGKVLDSPREIEVKEVLEISRMTIMESDGGHMHRISSDVIYAKPKQPFTLNKTGFDDVKKWYTSCCLTELLYEKIEAITDKQINAICFYGNESFEATYYSNKIVDLKKKLSFLEKFKRIGSNLLTARMMYAYGPDETQIYESCIVIFTETEIEERFEFLKNKAWLLPELRLDYSSSNPEKYMTSITNLYHFYLFTKIYKDDIKEYSRKKRMERISLD